MELTIDEVANECLKALKRGSLDTSVKEGDKEPD
jgi:hypothetical protein